MGCLIVLKCFTSTYWGVKWAVPAMKITAWPCHVVSKPAQPGPCRPACLVGRPTMYLFFERIEIKLKIYKTFEIQLKNAYDRSIKNNNNQMVIAPNALLLTLGRKICDSFYHLTHCKKFGFKINPFSHLLGSKLAHFHVYFTYLMHKFFTSILRKSTQKKKKK